MAPDIVDTLHNQRSLRFDTDMVDELGYGRQMAAWENIVVYKAEAASVSFNMHT